MRWSENKIPKSIYGPKRKKEERKRLDEIVHKRMHTLFSPIDFIKRRKSKNMRCSE
jgi:tetrahydromethanopterin S-methyltransferase subunit G